MADLIESFDNGVLSIVFNRPERKNALSGEMLTMLNPRPLFSWGMNRTIRAITAEVKSTKAPPTTARASCSNDAFVPLLVVFRPSGTIFFRESAAAAAWDP